MQSKKFPPLVVFKDHVCDGHGYSGPIAIGFGATSSVIVFRDEPETGMSYLEGPTPADLPCVVGTYEVDTACRARVYQALDAETRQFMDQYPGSFDHVQLVGVHWSDGRKGAAVMWGSSVHATAVFLTDDGDSSVTLSCDFGDDEHPVPVDEALACVLHPSDAEHLRPVK